MSVSKNSFNKKADLKLDRLFCGAGGIRTHVQTYSRKAFYMLISALIVETWQELSKPTMSVAE